MLHEFAAHMCDQLWEPTKRRTLMRACTYKSLQTLTKPALCIPATYKHQSWVWSSGVWVTGTKTDGAPAYELRRHPKDRMLIKEMYPRRLHKETRRCILKSWFHIYQNKRIYHQRNHSDAGICVPPESSSKVWVKLKKKKKTKSLLLWEQVACVFLCFLSPSFQVTLMDRMPAEQWPVRCLTCLTQAFWLTHITGTWRELNYTKHTHTRTHTYLQVDESVIHVFPRFGGKG